MEVRRLGRSEPAFSPTHIKRLKSMEDFQREELLLNDRKAFDNLVGFTKESLKVMIGITKYTVHLFPMILV